MKKLTKEEIDKNLELMLEAISFARLDNNAKMSEEDYEFLMKIVNGEITNEEADKMLIDKYKKNS